MRRLVLASAVTAVLALPMATPAVAAPDHVPWPTGIATATCGSETWDVLVAVDFERWAVDGFGVVPAGTTPDKAMGGAITTYFEDGTSFSFPFGRPVGGSFDALVPPPGLTGTVDTCSAVIRHPTYYVVVDPLYLLRTPH